MKAKFRIKEEVNTVTGGKRYLLQESFIFWWLTINTSKDKKHSTEIMHSLIIDDSWE